MRLAALFVALAALLVPLLGLATLLAADEKKDEKPAITWKKTHVDKAFRSEGVTAFDVNKDGKPDIVNGEVWYEAPDWKMHEIRKSKDYTKGKENVYSNSFACWPVDVNGDGWTDVIVIGFPGAPCHWYENPGKGGFGKHWKQHEIWHSACNETPQYVDLFGDGKRVLVMGYEIKGKPGAGQMAYFTPGEDPTKPWTMHPISEEGSPITYRVTPRTFANLIAGKADKEVVKKLAPLEGKEFATPKELEDEAVKLTDKKSFAALKGGLHNQSAIRVKVIPGTDRFSHGLGVGDVNGDGRPDVICTGGWWEQPQKVDGKTPWKFHAARLGDDCADMYAFDIDGDGVADVLSSSAHRIGIWWHKQIKGKDGKPNAFRTEALFPKLVSQTHALVMADVNGDKLKDFVTGKRWWAHGPSGDVNPNDPARVYWFEAKKSKDGLISFTPHEIDNDSGIGTQFYVGDINGDGLLDVVTSNKKGTFLLEQVRAKK